MKGEKADELRGAAASDDGSTVRLHYSRNGEERYFDLPAIQLHQMIPALQVLSTPPGETIPVLVVARLSGFVEPDNTLLLSLDLSNGARMTLALPPRLAEELASDSATQAWAAKAGSRAN